MFGADSVHIVTFLLGLKRTAAPFTRRNDDLVFIARGFSLPLFVRLVPVFTFTAFGLFLDCIQPSAPFIVNYDPC